LAGWLVGDGARQRDLGLSDPTSMIAPVPFWMNYEQNGH